MTLPRNGFVQPVEGVAGGGGAAIPVSGDPGTVITTFTDTPVAPAATVPLPVVPSGARRCCVQVVGGSSTAPATIIRVREVGGAPGSGRLLQLYDSTLFGGADGALEDLEVENVAGPAASVHIDYERD